MRRIYTIIALVIMSIVYTNAQTPEFWGMTSSGGTNGAGVIFKTDGSGDNQTVVHSFLLDNEGAYPNYTHLLKASNGKVYGMTGYGGIYDYGVIFEYEPSTNTYTKKYDFDGDNGSHPWASLMEASNGKLYGTCGNGGVHKVGVLFEYDPSTDTYTKIYDFDTITGAYPTSTLVEAPNGKLYGTTSRGGTNNAGVIFEYDPATNTFAKKYDFDGTNGGYPETSLTLANNGKLYGVAPYGGSYSEGVLFEYDPSTETFTKRFDFNSAITGVYPYSDLIQASDGNLYGTTYLGGNNNLGIIYRYDISSDTVFNEYHFDGTNGEYPFNALLEASNGKLYGMATYGGTNNFGVLFEYDPATVTYTKKYDFDGTNGKYPYGSFMLASNGKLYGMTYLGGKNNYGVLFEYDPASDAFTKKLDFNNAENGSSPYASLFKASNNKFYGLTKSGGQNGKGILFEYDPASNVFSKKFDFDGTNGAIPIGSLIEASNNKLYGTTSQGGAYDDGVLFEYDPQTDNFVKKIDFSGDSGVAPVAALVEASNGKLYGMTNIGGVNNNGVIFEYDPANNTFTKKIDFDGNNKGSRPFGSLMEASNGKLYGLTYSGGANWSGVLFEYDPATDTYTKKYDFDGTNGSYPYGSLVEANGKLYGVTSNGGTNYKGVLFEYDPATDTYTKKLDFVADSGISPMGTLMLASNGKLYGMTNQGGANNYGVLFEYDPATDTYTKKLDFDLNNGADPLYSTLIETNLCTFTTSTVDTTVCDSYVAPSGTVYTTSGTYTDTIPNSCGADSLITINLTVNTIDTSVTQNGDTLIANLSVANYQWIDCSDNSPVSGATNQTFVPTVSGSYAVVITNNGCIDTSSCHTVTIAGLNPLFSSVQIYPNPSNGIVNIDLADLQNVSIKVYDATGKMILSEQNINEKIHKLNLNQPAGFYVIELTADNQIQRYKLMIK